MGAQNNQPKVTSRISLSELGREPFRIFFPAAVLAGLFGVSLWPLFFGGMTSLYPGQGHARIMAYGFFGGFIFGFLGTAMPRMLSVPPLGLRNVSLLFTLYVAMNIAFATGHVAWGDGLFATLLVFFATAMILRVRHREALPPPGFVLVGMSFACVFAAAVMALWQHQNPETGAYWHSLQKLLGYQGFVLLPILGIGPFILPRFFGMPSSHDLPDSIKPSSAWRKKAVLALSAGLLIVVSFFIEAAGNLKVAYGLRFIVTAAYLLLEFPFRTAKAGGNALTLSLRLALALMAAGFLAVMLFPAYRTGLLHLTLMGGFAVVTFVVATRVIFGHSGNLAKLKLPNRWVFVAVSLMIMAMATRLSGDLWPKLMVSHYNYGVLVWAAGVLLWAWKVLPRVLEAEPED
ncbi:MAG: NnrS family protein [Verrucomicrobia bacterium]|nr:NnrS family protein [Verrucomicrobiota bacterium]